MALQTDHVEPTNKLSLVSAREIGAAKAAA